VCGALSSPERTGPHARPLRSAVRARRVLVAAGTPAAVALQVAGVRSGRLPALWEPADARWSGRARATPEPHPECRNVRSTPCAWDGAAGPAAATVTALAVLLSGPHGASSAATGTAPATFTPGLRRPADGQAWRGAPPPTDAACSCATARHATPSGPAPAVSTSATGSNSPCRAHPPQGDPRRRQERRQRLPGNPDDGRDAGARPGDARVCLIPADGRRLCFAG
jgi:hypothetical protein